MTSFIDRLPKLIKEDFFRKLIAVFFACLIWYYVNSKISEDETFTNVEVKVELSSADMRVTTPPPNVSITLSGPRKHLERLDSSEIEVLVKLGSNASKGRQQSNLTNKNVTLAKYKELRIVKISPKTVHYELDRIETKIVAVQLMVKDELNERFSLDKDPRVKPAVVRIKGASRRLATVDRVFTELVHLDKNRNRDFEVPATILTPEGVELADGYNKVTAMIDLKELSSVENFKGIEVYPLVVGKEVKGKYLIKNKVKIWLSGPPDILERLKIEHDIRLFVEIDDDFDEQKRLVKFWSRYPEVKLMDISEREVPVYNTDY